MAHSRFKFIRRVFDTAEGRARCLVYDRVKRSTALKDPLTHYPVSGKQALSEPAARHFGVKVDPHSGCG